MKPIGKMLALAALLLTATAAQSGVSKAKKPVKGVRWQKNYAEALRRARRTYKPVLVDFYADWCGPCRMLDQTTWKNPAVVRESRRWLFVKVNVDQQQSLAAKYKVNGIPAVFMLRPNGSRLDSFMGYRPAEDALKLLRQARLRLHR